MDADSQNTLNVSPHAVSTTTQQHKLNVPVGP